MGRALAIVALAVVASLGGAGTAGADQKPSFAGAELPDRPAAPSFALRDQNGRLVSLASQRGRFVLVTFLYTHCPDVCPIIATNLNTALRRLDPAERSDVRVLAVSVDPEGDTPQAVKTYVKQRHLVPEFRYLIGSRPELHSVWKKFQVQAVARDPELVDHTAYTLLVDRDGKGIVVYPTDFKMPQVLHDLRQVLAS